MLQRRTDLAVEAHALWQENAGEAGALPGVRVREDQREGFPVTRAEILDAQGAAALGKPVGRYTTVDLTGLVRRESGAFSRAVQALAGELSSLLKGLSPAAPVLVAGLGNRAVTPDAVGPRAADQTLVTRHLVEQLPGQFGALRPVSAVAAGVLGTTGLESGELIRAVVRQTRPACVIAVDALAARSLERVCRTVQLSDTGIVPGSGVGNARAALNEQTLGVPVYAVGAPTVVDGATLAADLLSGAGLGEMEPESLRGGETGLFVTPRDIDERVADLSRVIGYGLTLALQPGLTLSDLELLLS